MKVMLRRTESGELTDHHFLDQKHALEWLKKDTTNEERFTVCLVEQQNLAPFFMRPDVHSEVVSEMTVGQFIAEAMTAKDKKNVKEKA